MNYNDKPTIDFNLDAYKAEADQTPFVFTFGGKPWTFEHIDQLDGWGVAEAFAGGEGGADNALLKLTLGKEYAAFREIPGFKRGKMVALIKRYLAHCGIETGN